MAALRQRPPRAAAAAAAVAAAAAAAPPASRLNTTQLIAAAGWPVEEHWVTTRDGYVLAMQRIPARPAAASRGAVLYVHGLIDSAHSAAVQPAGNASVAFSFAAAGFDVWLANCRGRRPHRHVTLSPHSDAFWDFSWADMAEHDLPAFVSHALQVTGDERLAAYVGHSQGTMVAFAAFSSDPTLASKVGLFAAMAPVTFLNATGVDVPGYVQRVLDFFCALVPNGCGSDPYAAVRDIGPAVCSDAPAVCRDLLCGIAGCGDGGRGIDASLYPVIFSPHGYPADTSARNLDHYAQMAESGRFRGYDYGSAQKNMAKYNATTPPDYDLGRVGVDIALFSGTLDKLADPADVARTKAALPSARVVYADGALPYGHGDFIWGADAHARVYDVIQGLAPQRKRGLPGTR